MKQNYFIFILIFSLLTFENIYSQTTEFTTEYLDLNNNQVPSGWSFEAIRSADISNERMNAYITDGVASMIKEGIVSNSTQEIILEMDAYIAYSYWGLINSFRIGSGNKYLAFYSGEEEYEFPKNQIGNFVTYKDDQNGTRIHESLAPSVPGTYHFKLIMNNSGYEFIGTDPNGQESFKINIDSNDYFDFKDIDKITFGISAHTQNSGWMDNLKITVISDSSICENVAITNATYPETDDLNQRIKEELGDSYAIADWNDLKNMTNLDDWISCMNIKHDDTFFTTRDGNYIYSSNRQYFVHYSTDGVPYSGFAVHDQVGDFYLGSWYGLNMKILAKNNETNTVSYFKTEYLDLNNNQAPSGWAFETVRSADISNGRMNAYITDGGAYMIKEGIVSNSTQEIVLEMDAYIAYSYWGLINSFIINSGEKYLAFYSGEEDYEFPKNQIANFITYQNGQNGIRIHESLSPSVPGTYHFELILNSSGYEFIGTDPNGQESFKTKIDSKDYFDFKEIDKISFNINAHTQNSGWMDNIKITVSESSLAIDRIDKFNFNVFPNPASNILTIDSKLQIKKVELFSILGKKIKEVNTNFNSISLNNLSNGIYLLRIESEQGFAVKKLIKQ